MVTRRLAPVLLVLVLAACGGNGGKPAAKAEAAASAKWAAGLHRWGAGMTGAIDGLSVLFSQPADVRGIQAGSTLIATTLARYERVLSQCSARVRRLGPPPASLLLAQHEALHACVSLERAARLIRKGVAEFQQGLGPDVLNATSAPLSAGQDGVRRAELDLSPG